MDRSRRVLIAEGGSSTKVRSIERDGTINTVAGGGASAPANGLLATSAALSSPTGMVIDPSGSVIVAVAGSNQLWTLRPARGSS